MLQDQQRSNNSLDRSDNSLRQQASRSLNNSYQNQPNSHLSGSGHVSREPWEEKENSQTLQDSFSRTNMMDPEARKLRNAYERVNSLRMAPDKGKSKEK